MKRLCLRTTMIIFILAFVTTSCYIPIYTLRSDASPIIVKTGSRSGRVVDAVTGKPIEGAVVYCRWEIKEFLIEPTVTYGARYDTLTDEKGKYFIPSQSIKSEHALTAELGAEDVVVYKYGYVVYLVVSNKVQPAFAGLPELRQKYRRKNNLVKLQPWPEEFSHLEHMKILKPWSRPLMKKAVKEEEILAEKERKEKNRHRQKSSSGLFRIN